MAIVIRDILAKLYGPMQICSRLLNEDIGELKFILKHNCFNNAILRVERRSQDRKSLSFYGVILINMFASVPIQAF